MTFACLAACTAHSAKPRPAKPFTMSQACSARHEDLFGLCGAGTEHQSSLYIHPHHGMPWYMPIVRTSAACYLGRFLRWVEIGPVQTEWHRALLRVLYELKQDGWKYTSVLSALRGIYKDDCKQYATFGIFAWEGNHAQRDVAAKVCHKNEHISIYSFASGLWQPSYTQIFDCCSVSG